MVYPIHILRGVSAWMVVIHHFAQSYILKNSLPPAFETMAFLLGIGVDVFFIISGYVMSLVLERPNPTPYLSAKEFTIKRVARIFPAWWFYLILFTIFGSYVTHIPYTIEWNTLSFLKSALLIPHNNLNHMGPYPILYVGWSLMYELFFYGLIGALLLIPIARYHIINLVIVILLLLGTITHEENLLLHSNFFFLEFLAGFLFRRKSLYVGAFIMWATVTIYLLYGLFESTRFMFACAIFTTFMGLKLPTSGKVMNLLSRSGDVSFSIYLCHLLIIGAAFRFIPATGEAWHDSLALIATLILTFICACMSYHFIEQPFSRTARGKKGLTQNTNCSNKEKADPKYQPFK